MESLENRDAEMEQSFSFRNCNGFNSAATVAFSGDENDDIDDDDDDDDDDDSYIEIAIEPIITIHKDNFDRDDEGQSCEMRISFSSTVPAQESHAKEKTMDLDMEYEIATPSTWASSSAFTFSSSSMADSSADQWDDPAQEDIKQLPSTSTCGIQNTVRRRIPFPAVNRFLNMLMPSLKVSTEIGRDSGQANLFEAAPSSATRKASKLTTINSGNMMKFLIKFRAQKIRAMLASFMKPCQVNSWLDKSNASTARYKGNSSEEPLIKTPVKPFDKWLVLQRDQGTSDSSSNNNNNNNPNYNILRNGDEMRSSMLEIKMESSRGVTDAMNMTKFGRKHRKTKSCPSSSKSSPVQQRIQSENYKMSVRDNSIQAAIAHCKR